MIDQALANVSDLPSVTQDYNTGRDYRTKGFGFSVESGTVSDLLTFFFALQRIAPDLVEGLHDALNEERTFTGTTWFFPGYALEGRSGYDDGSHDPIDWDEDIFDNEE